MTLDPRAPQADVAEDQIQRILDSAPRLRDSQIEVIVGIIRADHAAGEATA
jgi:hypothetical protein